MLPLNSMLQMKKNEIEAYCKEAKIKLPKGSSNAVVLINAVLTHQGQTDQLISIPKGMTLLAAAGAGLLKIGDVAAGAAPSPVSPAPVAAEAPKRVEPMSRPTKDYTTGGMKLNPALPEATKEVKIYSNGTENFNVAITHNGRRLEFKRNTWLPIPEGHLYNLGKTVIKTTRTNEDTKLEEEISIPRFTYEVRDRVRSAA